MDFTSDKTTDVPDETLSSGDFFPDISLRNYQLSMLTDGKVTTERLRHALVNAMIEVNRELSAWKQSQTAAGFTSLAAVPADHINNDSELILLYRRAVYSEAKANLTERYRDTAPPTAAKRKPPLWVRPWMTCAVMCSGLYSVSKVNRTISVS